MFPNSLDYCTLRDKMFPNSLVYCNFHPNTYSIWIEYINCDLKFKKFIPWLVNFKLNLKQTRIST